MTIGKAVRGGLVLLAVSASAPIWAARDEAKDIRYTPPPAWVTAPPAPTDGSPPEGAPVRITHYDFQTRATTNGVETYTGYRIKLLKPEALPLGKVTLSWHPDAGSPRVHSVRLIRDGQTIDVLKEARFRVLNQEDNIDASVLSGVLTAVLQIPGLAVGDELEFSATVYQRDPTLGDRVFGFTQLPVAGVTGAFRARLLWPQTMPLRWRATSDLGLAEPGEVGRERLLAVELRDPKAPALAEGAPARVNQRRMIEYSDFADWAEVSHRVLPLFEAAARLAPASPLRAEIAKIAGASNDPVARTQAALRLVQEQVRYVYVGLDGGNYRPATIDETWRRRFGDCKAKTALLLAILRELGVAAEAVLVSSGGGDGFDQRLPSPGLFDHVLVRATIGEKSYWLDGTRMGDVWLDRLPDVPYRWVLPLRAAAVDLEKVAPVAPREPQFIEVTDIDATAGFNAPARVSVRHVVRGSEAFQLRSSLAAMSGGDSDRALKSYWRGEANWVDADKVGWAYDERNMVLTLTLAGSGKPEWEGDERNGRRLDILGAGFSPPARLVRPKEQDQTAPWVTDFPRFRCWATTIRLPSPRAGWTWDYSARPVDRSLGGIAYWRRVSLEKGVMRTIMSRRTLTPEISAVVAGTLNDAIPGFDNKISRVEETRGAVATRQAGEPLGDFGAVDWSAAPALCAPPAGGA